MRGYHGPCGPTFSAVSSGRSEECRDGSASLLTLGTLVGIFEILLRLR